MGRAPCCQKVGLKRGRWTAEEDQILINYVRDNGEGSWRSLPINAGLLRCGKSCRLRWINYLRTDLKRGNISPQEEDLIIRLHATLGNRWSLIASQLPGRTDNEIKNHWNSHLRRSINTWRRPLNDSLPQHILDSLAKMMVKPNPSTKKESKKNDAPTIEESKSTTHREDIIDDDGDENNDKPHTPELSKESLPSKISWSEQSLQSIFSLEDQQEVGDLEELRRGMDPLYEGAEDTGELLLRNNETVTHDPDSSLLTMTHCHPSNEIQNSAAPDVLLMNDLPDLSINHAEMDPNWLPTFSSARDTTTYQPSPSPSKSSLYTFDQMMNMSTDWNWDDHVYTQNQDSMNHELGSLMSWLWDGDYL